jgi:hypothetical protein
MADGYRVTQAEDGTFPVELWSSKGGRERLVYKTRGFPTRELAEAWMVPVEVPSNAPSLTGSRIVYFEAASVTYGDNQRPQSSSASRFTASQAVMNSRRLQRKRMAIGPSEFVNSNENPKLPERLRLFSCSSAGRNAGAQLIR